MNAPIPVSASPAPIAPHLGHAFGGVWRLTLARLFTRGHLLAVFGLLALLGLIAFSFIDRHEGSRAYVSWMIGFYLTFLVPLLAFINAGGAIRDEMKPSTTDYVLTRPLPRPAFVGFKFLAHLAGAQIEFLLSFAVMIGFGLYGHAAGILDAVPLLLLAQVVLVAAFSALGFLSGALTTRYVVLGLFYAGVIEVGVGQIPTQLNRLSMTHQVNAMLQPLIASGSPMNAAATLAPAGKLATVVILLGFTAVAIALTAMVFSLRELSGRTES